MTLPNSTNLNLAHAITLMLDMLDMRGGKTLYQ